MVFYIRCSQVRFDFFANKIFEYKILKAEDKRKRKLIEKGEIQPSEVDNPIREIKINPVFMNK